MFNRVSQLTITESVLESSDSVAESADFITNSTADPVKIVLWVQALSLIPTWPIY